MLNRLPWLLVLFRIASGPAMIALAFAGHGVACAVLLSLGVLSDIFDGIIARRLGVATPALRTWDSRADVAFWLCAVIAVAVLRPGLVPALWPAAAVIAALEVHVLGKAFLVLKCVGLLLQECHGCLRLREVPRCHLGYQL